MKDATMSSYADTLSDQRRRQFRMYAYGSTWVGCFSDVMLENSAIILLYLLLLGAGNTLTMLSTGMVGIASMFLLIPSSGIVDRFGPKRVVAFSSYIAGGAYLLMAAAPFLSREYAQYIVLAGCLGFSISKPLCNAAWYPILGAILKPDERGDFFGFMRFSYYILTGSVFCLLGIFMGKEPSLMFLQGVIAVTGLLALGRYFFIARIELPETARGTYQLKKAFQISVRNGPLVGFSVYAGFLSLAFAALLPLTLLYLKNELHYGDNVVQILSSAGIGGSICGFFFYGRLVRFFGVGRLQLAVHGAYILIPLGLFFTRGDGGIATSIFGILLFAGNFAFACFGCIFSQEVLALSRPGNITMASAFCQTYQMVGTACGRTVASLLLSNGVLAAAWQMGGMRFSHFQTLFLLSAGMALFCLILVFSLPGIVPKHHNYYNP